MFKRTAIGLLLISMGLSADQRRNLPLANQNPNLAPAFALLASPEQLALSDRWQANASITLPRGGHALAVVATGAGNRCKPLTLKSPDGAAVGRYWVLAPVKLDTPSSAAGQPGVYYDALLPFNATSCRQSPYRLLEWKPEMIGTYQLWLDTQMRPLTVRFDGHFRRPAKPMFVGLSNSFLIAGHCPSYCPMELQLGHAYRRLLRKHHLIPLQSWVLPLEVINHQLSLSQGSEKGLSFRQQGWSPSAYWREFPRLPASNHTAWLIALENTLVTERLTGRGWVYVQDEPADFVALKAELQTYRRYAPSVQTMVTTPWQAALDTLVDIWSPNIAHWQPDLPGYQGKEVWPYLSCQGSCGPDRRSVALSEKHPGPETGLPDLLIDRPVARLESYFQRLKQGGATGGLYYHAVEGYPLWRGGIDLIKDPWNFGGNGDGLLLYPGRPGEWGLKDHQPLASFRLKMMRQFIERHWAAP